MYRPDGYTKAAMKKFLFGIVFVLIGLVASPQAKSQSSVEDFTITITFAFPNEDPVSVVKAPYKIQQGFCIDFADGRWCGGYLHPGIAIF